MCIQHMLVVWGERKWLVKHAATESELVHRDTSSWSECLIDREKNVFRCREEEEVVKMIYRGIERLKSMTIEATSRLPCQSHNKATVNDYE